MRAHRPGFDQQMSEPRMRANACECAAVWGNPAGVVDGIQPHQEVASLSQRGGGRRVEPA